MPIGFLKFLKNDILSPNLSKYFENLLKFLFPAQNLGDLGPKSPKFFTRKKNPCLCMKSVRLKGSKIIFFSVLGLDHRLLRPQNLFLQRLWTFIIPSTIIIAGH